MKSSYFVKVESSLRLANTLNTSILQYFNHLNNYFYVGPINNIYFVWEIKARLREKLFPQTVIGRVSLQEFFLCLQEEKRRQTIEYLEILF